MRLRAGGVAAVTRRAAIRVGAGRMGGWGCESGLVIGVWDCVCLCLCVREREREKGREGGRE